MKLKPSPKITTEILADIARSNDWMQDNSEALTSMLRDPGLRKEMRQLTGDLWSLIEVIQQEWRNEDVRRQANEG